MKFSCKDLIKMIAYEAGLRTETTYIVFDDDWANSISDGGPDFWISYIPISQYDLIGDKFHTVELLIGIGSYEVSLCYGVVDIKRDQYYIDPKVIWTDCLFKEGSIGRLVKILCDLKMKHSEPLHEVPDDYYFE